MNQFKDILGPMRLPFLLLTPACVLLGLSTAVWTIGHVRIPYVILALTGAVSAHISVNALNEYFDFKSGIDFNTERTPFSGGSGTLPEKPRMARYALATGLIAFAVTCFIGIYFLIVWGLPLLPLGIIGLLIVLFYTPWLTRNPLVCLIAPGLGFGPLMVMGTDFVLTGEYSLSAFIASLVPFFLVNNLLLLNQFPDRAADRGAGRKHLPIAVGTQKSSLVYVLFLVLAYTAIIFGVCLDKLPEVSLLGLLTIAIAVPTCCGVCRYGENIKKLMPYMAVNVIIIILTPVLVATGLLIG